MSGRALLFLISILIVAGSLASAAWLLATGKADSFDELFLFLSSLVIAGVFSLYLKNTLFPTPDASCKSGLNNPIQAQQLDRHWTSERRLKREMATGLRDGIAILSGGMS
jgi:hypothetical protein